MDDFDDELFNKFFQEKPVKILLAVSKSSEPHASQLADQVDTTYSHAVKVCNRFRENGLVTYEKKGRRKILSLTSDGRVFADQLESLFDRVGFDWPDSALQSAELEEVEVETESDGMAEAISDDLN